MYKRGSCECVNLDFLYEFNFLDAVVKYLATTENISKEFFEFYIDNKKYLDLLNSGLMKKMLEIILNDDISPITSYDGLFDYFYDALLDDSIFLPELNHEARDSLYYFCFNYITNTINVIEENLDFLNIAYGKKYKYKVISIINFLEKRGMIGFYYE